MKKSDIYTSGWLKSSELMEQGHHNGLDLTIKAVRTSKPMDDGTIQRCVSFVEDDRELGLNATNWDSLSEIFGQLDDDNWPGGVANFYPHKLDRPFKGSTHGIRVRLPQGVGPARAPAGQQQAPPQQAQYQPAAYVPPATIAPPAWSWAQVLAEGMRVGMTEDQIKAGLKAAGLTGYVPSRDTARVVAMLAASEQETQIPF